MLHHGTILRRFLAKRMKKVVRRVSDRQSHKEGVLSLTASPQTPPPFMIRLERGKILKRFKKRYSPAACKGYFCIGSVLIYRIAHFRISSG